MNEIRQLCTTSSSPGKHLDEILALFHACPPQHLLPSLSLIGQSISCMSIEQLDLNLINHPIFLLIRQWSERLLQLWLINGILNSDEYRAIFYIHQLFKLLSEWFIEQDNILLNDQNDELINEILKNLFLEENFLQTLCQVINQLINNENDKQHHISDNDDDQLSPDDIQLQTQISDIQIEQSDVLDVLYRCINCLVILYSHRSLINHSIVNKYLTPCILNCLNSSLFIQYAMKFLRENLTSDKINIRFIFILFTCLDYSTLSIITTSTLQFIPSINHIFHIWYEISKHSNNDISLLIIRLIRFINRLAIENQDIIIKENFCHFLLPHFDILCQTSNLIDDLTSLLITLCSTMNGKQYLRQLNFVQYILHEVKRHIQLWHPLGLLITQDDLYQTSIFKRLIHLLIQRTVNVFQSLTTASNDASFDSTTESSKHQIATTAIEWFILLRRYFLSFSMIVDELINSTKKVNFIHIFIDTLLYLEQDDDSLPKLIHVMIELLWTFTFSKTTNIQENLQKHIDLCQWLRTNIIDSIPNIRLASQAILFILDLNTKIPIQNTLNRRSSIPSNIHICMLNSDESYHELCLTLRNRLQTEQKYSVELILTSTCQSIDSLIYLLNRSSLCLFCASIQMKNDNLSHFIYYYLLNQVEKIPLLTILLENNFELNGNWIEHLTIINIEIILKEIQHYLNQTIFSRQITNISLNNHISKKKNFDQIQPYMQRSVCYWSSDDVHQWCEATQGNFESLRPLMMRLNGPALVHLAEILSIEPASMYHSLNEELLQRTGTSVPLTEYVSLQSELERLLHGKPNQSMTISSIENNSKNKKKWKNSRFCSLF